MKCGAWIVEVTTPKGSKRTMSVCHCFYNNSRTPMDRVLMWSEPKYLGVRKTNTISAPSLCDGNIVCKIEAVDDPYYGGSSASLEITYRCDRCGITGHQGLPDNSEDLSRFMTDKIAEMPDIS